MKTISYAELDTAIQRYMYTPDNEQSNALMKVLGYDDPDSFNIRATISPCRHVFTIRSGAFANDFGTINHDEYTLNIRQTLKKPEEEMDVAATVAIGPISFAAVSQIKLPQMSADKKFNIWSYYKWDFGKFHFDGEIKYAYNNGDLAVMLHADAANHIDIDTTEYNHKLDEENRKYTIHFDIDDSNFSLDNNWPTLITPAFLRKCRLSMSNLWHV